MAADQPRTALDVILAPTQHQTAPGVLTISIPRHLLDSKNPDGTDKAFRVTLDGHGLAWQQIQETNTDRVIGLYFTGGNEFLEVFGTNSNWLNKEILFLLFTYLLEHLVINWLTVVTVLRSLSIIG